MKRPRMCVPMATGGGSSWSSLPGDLLEQISHHLSTDADHLHIHQVCAHWRASTSPPTAFRPWVVARRMGQSSRLPSPVRYSVWQLPRRGGLQDEVEIRDPPAGLPYCLGASRGWLALADSTRSPTRLVLWDPASGAELRLPPLGHLVQVFLSGDPLASPPSDWVAVATQFYGNQVAHKSFFWRPGDAAWSVLSEQATAGIETVAFHGGRVYYMDWRWVLVVCDISLAPPLVWPMNMSRPMFRRCSCQRYHGVRGAQMVTCAGELLLVILRVAGGHPSFAEVYKTEWTPENMLELRDRVTDLGDHSLFLGRAESFALSAREYPAIKRNHVYGLALQARCGDSTLTECAYVYDLSSDTLKEIQHPKELREDGTKIWRPLYWLCLRSSYKKNQQQ